MVAPENQVRAFLERMTGWGFPPRRPWWLRPPGSDRALELAGYNVEHHLAFEHTSGAPVPLPERQREDAFTDWKCAELRVALIRTTDDDTTITLVQKLRNALEQRHWSNSEWARYTTEREARYRSTVVAPPTGPSLGPVDHHERTTGET